MDVETRVSRQRAEDLYGGEEGADQVSLSGGSLTKKRKIPTNDLELGVQASASSFSSFLKPVVTKPGLSAKTLHRSVSAPSFDGVPAFSHAEEDETLVVRKSVLCRVQEPAASISPQGVLASSNMQFLAVAEASMDSSQGNADTFANLTPRSTSSTKSDVTLHAPVLADAAVVPGPAVLETEEVVSSAFSLRSTLQDLGLVFQASSVRSSSETGVSVQFLSNLAAHLPPCFTSMEVLKQLVLPLTTPHGCRFVDLLPEAGMVSAPSAVVCHFLDAPFHKTVEQILDALPSESNLNETYVWMDLFSCVHREAIGASGQSADAQVAPPVGSITPAAFAARHIWVSPTALISAPSSYQDAKKALDKCSRVLLCLDFHAMTLSQPLSVSVLYRASALYPKCEVLLAGEDVDITSMMEALQHLDTWEACACGATLSLPDAPPSPAARQRLRRVLLATAGVIETDMPDEMEVCRSPLQSPLQSPTRSPSPHSLPSPCSLPSPKTRAAAFSRLQDDKKNSIQLLWLLGSKQYSGATRVGHELLKQYASLLGVSHPQTLKVVCGLAAALYHQGESGAQQADRLLSMVLDAKKGLELDTEEVGAFAAWLSNLARAVQGRGILDKAESLMRWSMQLRLHEEECSDSPATVATLSNLAAVLELRGSFGEAEELLKKRIAICERLYPSPHPDKASSRIHLGIILAGKGEFTQAVELAKLGVQMRKDIFGDHHLATAAGMSDLASLMKKAAGHEEGAAALSLLTDAEQLLSQCLATRQKLLGADHPDVLSCVALLASLIQSQGQVDRANQVFQNARTLCEQARSEEGLATLLSGWAASQKLQGHFKESEEMLREALVLREKVLGTQHLDTATSMSNLAVLLHRQGSYEEAEELCRSSLAMKQKLLGSSHPDVATLRNNLAAVLKSQGHYDEAEQLYWKSLDALHKSFGRRHLEVTTMMNNLAALLEARGKLHMAEALYKEYLATIQESHGEDHPDLAVGMNNLAALLCRMGKYTEAEPLASRALDIWQTTLGPEHPDTAASLHNLAALYKAQKKYEAARTLYAQSVEVTEKILGPEHPNLAASLNNLAVLAQAQGNYTQAEPLYWRCLQIYETALGPDHPNCVCTLSNLVQLLRAQGRDWEVDDLLAARHVAAPSPGRAAPSGTGLWRSASLAQAM